VAAAEVVAFLRANTSEFTAALGKAKAEVDGLSREGSSNFSKLSSVGKAATAAVAGGLIALGVAAVDFGDKQELAQAQLQAALRASGESWDKVKGSVASTGAAATKYGFTQAQVDAALASGVISTQSYSKAHKELSVAIELAAAKHVDLQTAMVSVEKAANGQLRPLKQLGIDLPVATGGAEKLKKANDALASAQAGLNLLLLSGAENAPKNSKAYAAYEGALAKVHSAQQNVNDVSNTGNTILEALQKRMSGQASAAADTLQGRMAAMRAQAENVAASIGVRLIPILERMMSAVSHVVTWLEKHKAVAITLAAVLGGVLLAAIAAYTISMISAAAATIAAAAPILAVVAVVGLLAAAAYELVQHWNTVVGFFVGLWHDVMEAFHNPIVAIVGTYVAPFIALPLIIISHWNDVEAAFKVIWAAVSDAVKTAWGILKPIFDFIINYYTALITTAITVLKTAFQVGWTLISTVVQTAWGILKPIFDFVVSYLIGTIVGAVNTLMGVWNTVWNTVSSVVSSIWGTIGPIFSDIANFISNTITGAINGLESAWSSAWGAIGKAISGAWNSVIAPAINGIIGGINDLIKAWNSLPFTPNIPTIPTVGHRALGGPVDAMSPYMVGEAGPELFVPTGAGTIIPNSGLFGAGGSAGAQSTGPQTAVAQVSVSIDGQTFLQAIQPALIQWQRANNAPTFGTPGVVANA
jgi:hypothetical protein